MNSLRNCYLMAIVSLLAPLLLLSWLDIGSATATKPQLDAKEINAWVQTIANNFEQVRRQLGIEKFERKFEENRVVSDNRNEAQGQQLMNDIKARIGKFTYKYEEHVKRIRVEAEYAFAGHTHRNYSLNCLELKDQPFLRATAIEDKPHESSNNTHQNLDPESRNTVYVMQKTEDVENFCSAPTLVELNPDPRLYGVETNRKVSTAHVPSNIYDASTSMLNAANWSQGLDKVFESNAALDPMLKWQYFGNTEGLFKIYPGIRWYIQTKDLGSKDITLDFFDCRTQYWYLLAASYPKDMVILLDNSGSMKGRRSIIANMTLTELLYTLNVNDFFNVIMFMNSSLKYISDDFNFTMLQATEKNKYTVMDLIREDENRAPQDRQFAPLGISDYKEALEEAFQLLDYVKRNATDLSSGGVQNIVLISDGAPQTFQEVFKKYNFDRQVRVFTFLVGHEAAEEENVKKIACSNRGYFVQISTLSDVKENAQRYIPVTARTNALRRDHFFAWTGVHKNQIKTQLRKSSLSKKSATASSGSSAAAEPESAPGFTVFPFTETASTASPTTTPTSTPNSVNGSGSSRGVGGPGGDNSLKIVYKPSKGDNTPHQTPEEDPAVKNKLFASVAQAAYDIRDNETIHRGIGRLIGVAGVDVPTDHFERLGPAWELGALGYIFLVTNNGHVLFHPEFRQFDHEGNLRLFFNNRDIAEIEMPADESPLYNAPSYTLPLRLGLINRQEGIEQIRRIKTYEDFTRGFNRDFKYFYAPINSTSPDGTISRATPFSLALVLPWQRGSQWPPPLAYRSSQSGALPSEGASPETLERLLQLGPNGTRTCVPVGAAGSYGIGLSGYEFCAFPAHLLGDYNLNPICALEKVLASPEANRTSMNCSAEFLRRVVTDALSTEEAQRIWRAVDNATMESSGVDLFFLWTNTGLSRWHNRTRPLRSDFMSSRRNASREEMYEKTVLLSTEVEANSDLSVITVPLSQEVMANMKANNTFPKAFPVYLTSVIRSRVGSSGAWSPIGVAGAEIDYAKLEESFLSITSGCASPGDTSCVTCSRLNVQCYLLDRSGFVAVSEVRHDVGRGFDQVNCAAMKALVQQGYFERILSDSAVSIFQALAQAVDDAVVAVFGEPQPTTAFAKLTSKQCDTIEKEKPRRLLLLREEIDSKVDEVIERLHAKSNPLDKTAEVKKALVQPYCIAMQSGDQAACAHLCKRLRQKLEITVYVDLLGNCPKRVVKEVDCVLRRSLVKRRSASTGAAASSKGAGAIEKSCSQDFGYCQGSADSCSGDATFKVHIRDVQSTNLVFVAVQGDPNCNCRGCSDIIGVTELRSGPSNYTKPRPPRANPPWGQKDIRLQDNATTCSKRAMKGPQPLGLRLLLLLPLIIAQFQL
uniref:VWFA domain-containing protein n=1 Tax=Macrostomum lignano TaxID=282301 RepID=A0A1I8I3Y5_9PLAT